MNITYTWDFVSFRTLATLNGKSNVVTAVACYLNATDDQGHSAQLYSAVPLGEPGETFVSFEDLNPDIVCAWVESALGATLDDYRTALATEIQNQNSPAVVELSRPW
jgi:hypothetical protein